ncbi:MAG TPA: hypothetical protein VJ553_06210 [Candidatus Paceibacterota bacterium]|nr:hypothetical protein [Candidatus Paceibacterota bacterium]
MLLEKTKTLAGMLEDWQAPFYPTDPLSVFQRIEVREVRMLCLEAMERKGLASCLMEAAEATATVLMQNDDPLWKEFLRAYLFAFVRGEDAIRAFRFFEGVRKPDDSSFSRFRSKTLYHWLDTTFHFNDKVNSLYAAAVPYLNEELQYFFEWCRDRHFYQDDDWYRLERVCKVVLKANDWGRIPQLRGILNLYGIRGEKAIGVPWTGCDSTPSDILRDQHVAFLRGTIKILERARRHDEQARTSLIA